MAKHTNTRTVYRDSVDGRFITRIQAEKRPKTTEKQKLKLDLSKQRPAASNSNKGETN